MRKLEGVVKEIVDEMNYLKKREERFQATNSTFPYASLSRLADICSSVNKGTSAEFRVVHARRARLLGCMANIPPPRILQAEIPH